MLQAKIPTYYLQIGEVIASSEPSIVSTILGSCLSVCLFCKKTGMGGMIHFAHPRMLSQYGQEEDFRYGEVAIPALISELQRLTGKSASDFFAKIVGGAHDIGEAKIAYDIGAENIKLAQAILNAHKIPVVSQDLGGEFGRKVLFHTATGRLQVALVKPQAARAVSESSKILLSMASDGKVMNLHLTKKRKVLIVDDSKIIRDLIRRVLSEDPDFEITGSAADATEAAKIVAIARPDVITLDVNMPGINGLEWLERLLSKNAIPVVIISSMQLQNGNDVFRALELGAVDYIQKPKLSELPIVGPLIREKVKEASYAKVFGESRQKNKPAIQPFDADLRKILTIGASTGGTEAIKVVMSGLPARIPPTLIVQHIPAGFSKTFAERLNEICPFEVKEAEDGDDLRPSRVLVAPGGKQMKVQKTNTGFCVRITDDAPMNRHKPSVDYLFKSVASVIGKNSVGVILTGMGADGAKGLLEMKKQGSRTLTQDEGTSVVYGMPKVAFDIGAAEKSVSLDDMAAEILQALR